MAWEDSFYKSVFNSFIRQYTALLVDIIVTFSIECPTAIFLFWFYGLFSANFSAFCIFLGSGNWPNCRGLFCLGPSGKFPLVYCTVARQPDGDVQRVQERKVTSLAIWFWQKKSSKLMLKYPNLFRAGKESGRRGRWFIGLGGKWRRWSLVST